eukprot:TRINITY_DN1050_c0_g1_i3.p1 TRINITY_DN1050_c0_g1~~TRINITY_DN1050_c0_g1_i3.p1  ORF type:complete len:408 (+),score=32.90 TRINITY_DN1050_c0_g1_i3:628-1851(+)
MSKLLARPLGQFSKPIWQSWRDRWLCCATPPGRFIEVPATLLALVCRHRRDNSVAVYNATCDRVIPIDHLAVIGTVLFAAEDFVIKQCEMTGPSEWALRPSKEPSLHTAVDCLSAEAGCLLVHGTADGEGRGGEFALFDTVLTEMAHMDRRHFSYDYPRIVPFGGKLLAIGWKRSLHWFERPQRLIPPSASRSICVQDAVIASPSRLAYIVPTHLSDGVTEWDVSDPDQQGPSVNVHELDTELHGSAVHHVSAPLLPGWTVRHRLLTTAGRLLLATSHRPQRGRHKRQVRRIVVNSIECARTTAVEVIQAATDVRFVPLDGLLYVELTTDTQLQILCFNSVAEHLWRLSVEAADLWSAVDSAPISAKVVGPAEFLSDSIIVLPDGSILVESFKSTSDGPVFRRCILT